MNRSSRIGAKLKVLSAAFGQEANRRAAEVGLTGSQAFFLGYLSRHRDQPVYPRDLEQEFEFSHPTVSGILFRMEKKGFVTFRAGENDKRRKQILITEKGLQAHGAVIRHLDAVEQQALSGMKEAEIAEFQRLLSLAMENLGVTVARIPTPEQEEPQ